MSESNLTNNFEEEIFEKDQGGEELEGLAIGEEIEVAIEEEMDAGSSNMDETDEEELQDILLNKIFESQEEVIDRLNEMEKLFNSRIMHTEHEEKIVDQMHRELQKYKEDMYSQLIRPILLDIIDVRDSIMRMAATYLAKAEDERNIPNKTFSAYALDLQDILEKNEVEIYRSEIGDEYTPIKQRVIKKIRTSDESLHGKVAETFACGYIYMERVISAEKIAVYLYEEVEEEAKENEKSEVIESE